MLEQISPHIPRALASLDPHLLSVETTSSSLANVVVLVVVSGLVVVGAVVVVSSSVDVVDEVVSSTVVVVDEVGSSVVVELLIRNDFEVREIKSRSH